MITKERGPDWSINQTHSRLTYKERLESGQVVTVTFKRLRHKFPDEGHRKVIYCWIVRAHIGEGFRSAGRYKDKRNKITGRSGVAGLRVALRIIQGFAEMMDYRDEMQIHGSEEKRRRAYNYLLRFPGFIRSGDFIAYRNPEIYEWLDQ